MNKYPMFFKARAESSAGIQSLWDSQSMSVDSGVRMAIPAEFEGPGGGFSPEDLYVMALQNCFVATFKVFAEKSRLAYEKLRIESELTVDRDEHGRPWMARCFFNVHLEGAEQIENAKRILARASESCMILNSVKTEKVFEFHVS
ncbi:OsmC family protein [Bdellovibrio bacteriovorus]|uniref:Putative redox protein n=1 Tax=Bdellovibrio bacteriovorus (strain ATCC 15356 / DSM 50701 / NCIMB 9529 / HD100) TaxID=264462 RepID=Q6MPE6_BDEBA|nr:OsmC family protein [Bdellovibrio bacteriovorus]CAE78852.1 putative redox protein [Bdellovibrio bacteriovorus HD100]